MKTKPYDNFFRRAIVLPVGMRALGHASDDGTRLVSVGLDENRTVALWDWRPAVLLASAPAGPNKVAHFLPLPFLRHLSLAGLRVGQRSAGKRVAWNIVSLDTSCPRTQESLGPNECVSTGQVYCCLKMMPVCGLTFFLFSFSSGAPPLSPSAAPRPPCRLCSAALPLARATPS